MSDTLKRCHAGRGHNDAVALVEYLLAHGGKVNSTNESIAVALGMRKTLGAGAVAGRYVPLRSGSQPCEGQHEQREACTGYRLHYRTSGRDGEMYLIDPTGDLADHAGPTIETIRGWMVREAQHHTENQRQVETIMRLGDHALSRGDRIGYRRASRSP